MALDASPDAASGDASGPDAASRDGGVAFSDGGPYDSGVEGGQPDAAACPGTCAPLPPLGWEGPFELAQSSEPDAGAALSTPCDLGYISAAMPAGQNLVTPSYSCSCSCGAVTGGTCGSAEYGDYYAEVCPFQAPCFTGPVPTECAPIALTNHCPPDPDPNNSDGGFPLNRNFLSATYSGGACDPSLAVVGDAPYFATKATACAVAGPTQVCDPTHQCIPSPHSPFQSTPCISMSGVQTCPDGPYSVNLLFYQSYADGRACNPQCTCATESWWWCDTTIAFSNIDDPQCANILTETGSAYGCGLPNTIGYWRVLDVTPSASNSCQPSFSYPVADAGASPTSPITFCCMP